MTPASRSIWGPPGSLARSIPSKIARRLVAAYLTLSISLEKRGIKFIPCVYDLRQPSPHSTHSHWMYSRRLFCGDRFQPVLLRHPRRATAGEISERSHAAPSEILRVHQLPEVVMLSLTLASSFEHRCGLAQFGVLHAGGLTPKGQFDWSH